MPAERYYIDSSLQSGTTEELSGAEFHHLAHVMRTKKGSSVEIVNGRGTLATGYVHTLMRDKAILNIEDVVEQKESSCSLILAQALPKPNRVDFILEKGTELGVESFWFFPGDHSTNKNCYPSHLDRMNAVTIAAMKQCGRLFLPHIHVYPPISQWKSFTNMLLFYGDLSLNAPLFEDLWKRLDPTAFTRIIFVTGPEGGFSKNEMQALQERGALGVRLHPNILRTDTASIMALSLLSHWACVNQVP